MLLELPSAVQYNIYVSHQIAVYIQQMYCKVHFKLRSVVFVL
jgi:hypothetical protein